MFSKYLFCLFSGLSVCQERKAGFDRRFPKAEKREGSDRLEEGCENESERETEREGSGGKQ